MHRRLLSFPLLLLSSPLFFPPLQDLCRQHMASKSPLGRAESGVGGAGGGVSGGAPRGAAAGWGQLTSPVQLKP